MPFKTCSFFSTRKRSHNAFTLIEMMVTLAILSLVGFCLTTFFINSSKSMSWSVNKLMITYDFREFSQMLSQDSFDSNTALLYPSFAGGDMDDESDRKAVSESGDCLVLVTTEPFPVVNASRFYKKIVIYYRELNGDSQWTIYRSEYDFLRDDIPSGSWDIVQATQRLEEVVAARRVKFSEPRVLIKNSIGLANGQLFKRASRDTFFVNGDLFNGEGSQAISNVFHLTVSTRG